MNEVRSGNFTFINTSIDGVKVIETKCFGDSRGYFMETYKRPDFVAGGIDADFVQDNQSSSSRGVLRGLHFQIEHPQSKLVRVVEGEVFDVCVDLRPGSDTFGKWEGVILSAENHRQFFIPRGFAHGFLCLSETAVFAYKCDDVYHPNDEGGLMWNDQTIGIEWPALSGDEALDPSKLILSDKDQVHPTFIEWRAERGL
ncbi:dTDP-4-dehydrorhamnose 3,5-epimerase [Olsenella uli]|uniref:dTDP-4-dehydrorhamnose 3,5-epimerase n=1 Tax=Olsenella uli TaxID=133926 RepID=UPI0012AB4848|nr:dTDP-4-dehydrorhamnose 3,5-epimerase [Olsenella uli]